MANRRRRANARSARPRRSSHAESPTPQRRRPPLPQTHSTHVNDSNVFPRQCFTSARPSGLSQRRPRAHSVSETASAFKASVHSSPYLSSRCRTLKSQTAHLQQKLEELTAVIEELQPEGSAMDWATSAGTIIYVPVRVNRDNEAPRVSVALPEVRGPRSVTFPDASQYFRQTDHTFGFARATNLATDMSQQRTQPQPRSSSWEPACGTDMARQQGSSTEPRGQCLRSLFPPTFSFGNSSGQPATSTSLSTEETVRPHDPNTLPSANQFSQPRHAFAEDARPERPGCGGI